MNAQPDIDRNALYTSIDGKDGVLGIVDVQDTVVVLKSATPENADAATIRVPREQFADRYQKLNVVP